MHRIVKKTLQYTGFLFLSLIVLLIAGISYLYFSADMQTPKHEQSMTTDKVIDIDSLHLRYYGDNFLRHSDSGLWELFVKGDAFQRGEVNPEKPDVPINKNDAFQKVQKRRVQEKR